LPAAAASGLASAIRLPAAASGLHARALAASNLLQLLQCQAYRDQLNTQVLTGVRSNNRDALDIAGKLPLAVKALEMGISLGDFNIDPAQAGGLLGKFDAAVGGASGAASEGVEIKGAGSTSGPRTFKISRLRPGTPFEHLMLVLRQADPTDWTDVRQLDSLFWLGYMPRSAFDQAVAAKAGAAGQAELKASITIDSQRPSWLGRFVTFVPFHKLNKAWWDAHVRGGQPRV
jgi:hypothetical protein